MEALLSSVISVVGVLLGLMFLWLRSDIKALRSVVSEVVATLKDHGERLARLEALLQRGL
ncbi:MAG: hypothetical protein F4176_08185 [Acidimicrobiia bacterium]|nr:hypothetical protein [Acidimicrobiia bacterium]